MNQSQFPPIPRVNKPSPAKSENVETDEEESPEAIALNNISVDTEEIKPMIARIAESLEKLVAILEELSKLVPR